MASIEGLRAFFFFFSLFSFKSPDLFLQGKKIWVLRESLPTDVMAGTGRVSFSAKEEEL